MKQLSLTHAQAKLGKLVVEVEKRKRPIAITQGSKIKAVLVSAEWHSRVEEELAHYRRAAKQSPLKLRGSMTLTGDINQALKEVRKEREKSLEGIVSRLE
jgi:prevent-host-death family protein